MLRPPVPIQGRANAVCAIFTNAAEHTSVSMRFDPNTRPSLRKARAAFAFDVEWGCVGVFRLLISGSQGPLRHHMSSNSWTLNQHLPPTANSADPMTDYQARILREQREGAERSERERAEQSSDLNTPAVRIRAWERLHRLTLPRQPAHSVLSVIAEATRLTLEQVREEQRRRLAGEP